MMTMISDQNVLQKNITINTYVNHKIFCWEKYQDFYEIRSFYF